MYLSIFSATTKPDRTAIAGQYYKSLIEHVYAIPGFKGDTFFASPHTDRKSVNVAFWEDADAVKRWRNESNHLRLQAKGADSVYESYRLQLGPSIEFDEDVEEGAEEGARQWMVLYFRPSVEGIEPENDATLTLPPELALDLKMDMLDSLVFLGDKILWVTTWRTREAAKKFAEGVRIDRMQGFTAVSVRIERDYTRSDRADAPSEVPGGQ